MIRLLLMYGAIHVNVLLVSLFLMEWMDGWDRLNRLTSCFFNSFVVDLETLWHSQKKHVLDRERSLAFREPWRDGEYSSCHERYAFRN